MKALVSTHHQPTERAFLVGVELKSLPSSNLADSLEELRELAETAGATIVGSGSQKLESPNAATYVGIGKAEELAQLCKANNVDTVIFDDELSAAQVRNLEALFECKILDRTTLILDIFAQRARTREGKLQVELAQLEHLLPRLTRFWTHLSRQKGGIGMRGGEGESQLEADRRKTQERIDRIRDDLVLVQQQRATQRAGRQRHQWPLASIVGYTNAGKSTLLNRLTGAAVLAEDKLFATLDPTTRRLRLPTNQNILLSDTVGFIRKLPHDLVEAFKATLEEVVEAELLLHVVDASHPHAAEQIDAVNQVLKEIGALQKPTLMVFNKIDREAGASAFPALAAPFPAAVGISARAGEGIPHLLEILASMIRPLREVLELRIPLASSSKIARLHEVCEVLESDYKSTFAWFRACVPPTHRHEFAAFLHAP